MGRRGLGGGEGQGKTKEGVRRVAPAQGRSDLSPSGICSASEAGGRPGAPAPSPFLSLSPRPIQRSPRWRPWGLIGRPGADRGINWSSGRLRGPLAAHSPAASPSRRSCWVMGTVSAVAPRARALWALLLASLGTAAGQPLGGESVCTAQPLAKYGITFTGKWSQAAFPKQYPLFRPPAQWSALLGAAHSSDYSLWRKDQYVSNGLRDFVERGEAWALMREMEAAGEKLQSVHGVFSAPAVPSGTGQTSTELEVHSRHSLVSFAVRIIPSPDWFVGVDSLDLCDGDHWREQVAVDLHPYDAGTDSGFTFSSPNFATIPQDTVTEITASSPNHPANSFFYPRLKALPPIARVTLVQLRQSPRAFVPPALDLAGGGNEIVDSLPGDREEKCVIEDIPSDTLVTGTFKIQQWDIGRHDFLESAPGLGMFVTVTTYNDEVLLSKLYGPQGTFYFTSHSPGEHIICLESNSTRLVSFGGSKLRIHLDIRVGEHDLDAAIAQAKDKVNEVSFKLEHLIEQIEQIVKEQNYQRDREEKFRVTSEDTNSNVLWWASAQTLVLISVGIFQMKYLRDFFIAKKLV